jgi:hypothetical protein
MNTVFVTFNAFEIQIYVKVCEQFGDTDRLFIKAPRWTLSIVCGTQNTSRLGICLCYRRYIQQIISSVSSIQFLSSNKIDTEMSV